MELRIRHLPSSPEIGPVEQSCHWRLPSTRALSKAHLQVAQTGRQEEEKTNHRVDQGLQQSAGHHVKHWLAWTTRDFLLLIRTWQSRSDIALSNTIAEGLGVIGFVLRTWE